LGKTERIVNVSDLLMANMKKSGEAKPKGQYQYAAGKAWLLPAWPPHSSVMIWRRRRPPRNPELRPWQAHDEDLYETEKPGKPAH